MNSRTKNLIVGDLLRIIRIPAILPGGLLEEDQIAINAQLGKALIIEGFGDDGSVELEFVDEVGVMHTIWIDPSCLTKITSVKAAVLVHLH